MSDHLLSYLANCSLLFTEEPLLRRPAAARAAGFDAVEFWWPFAVPVPSDREVDAFTTAIEEAGVTLAGLNFFAGDLAGPDCGVLSIPGRSAEFRDNIDVVADIGERLGVRGFNALYGNRVDGVDPATQDELAAESIGLAAKAVASFGGTVLIEPVSGPKPYPLRTAADAVSVVRQARAAPGRRAPPTSASCATCTTWLATATTSTPRSPGTPSTSRTCRSPTRPGGANRAAASST
jgi:hydroxypyruvate isomerase